MRGVGHELALGRERLRQALGHVVERGGHLALLGRAVERGARLEVPAADPAGGGGERAHRPRQRAGQQRCDAEAEQQSQRSHQRERERVVAHLVVDGVDALGHAHGADRPARAHHRDGGEEQVLVEVVAAPLALRGAAAQGGRDLGPGRVHLGLEALPRRVREQPSARVHDHHAPAEALARAGGEPVELVAVVEPAAGAGRHELRLPGRLGAHLRVDALREVQRQRHRQGHDHQHQHVREGGDQPRAQAHASSSGPANRKPTPRTVCR
jgi:hypothetical protein